VQPGGADAHADKTGDITFERMVDTKALDTQITPNFTEKKKFPITSKYRHGVLNVDEIKN
jgi:hypothetical protein